MKTFLFFSIAFYSKKNIQDFYLQCCVKQTTCLDMKPNRTGNLTALFASAPKTSPCDNFALSNAEQMFKIIC